MNNTDWIVNMLRRQPGLDDDELSYLTGVRPRQQVNRIYPLMESQGQLRRERGPRGKIVNHLVEKRKGLLGRLRSKS